MAKPANLPRWAETVGAVPDGNIVEPNSGKKDTGFVVGGDIPTSGGLNWLLNTILQWLKWVGKGAPVDFDDLTTKAYVDAATAALVGGDVVLNHVGPQSIHKTNAGDLTAGTEAGGGDFIFRSNGVDMMKVRGVAGFLEVLGFVISGFSGAIGISGTRQAALNIGGVAVTGNTSGAAEIPAMFQNLAVAPQGGTIHIQPQAAPSAPADGQMWVESGTNTLKIRINGVTKTVTLT